MKLESAIEYAKPFAEGHPKGVKERALVAIYEALVKFTTLCNVCGKRMPDGYPVCEECRVKEPE
ncbi:MAG TPA: hypothetical protein ENI27_03395 [bacterium]|nr:hypothetical protein [bacterium]